MYKITAICDRCKAEVTETKKTGHGYTNAPKNWQKVNIKISQYEEKEYLFCEKCRKELGLINEEQPNKEVGVESVETRLFDCITEIVQMNI